VLNTSLQRCNNKTLQMPSPTPKRIYIRTRKDGKIACDEYIHYKRYNIIKPFKLNDNLAIGKMINSIMVFRLKNNNREVVAVCSSYDLEATQLAAKLNLTIE